jgi:hypothetical protein
MIKLLKFEKTFLEISKLTYIYPKPTDTAEYKQERMKEFNYNMTVIHCLREAIKMANFIIAR